MAVTPSSLRSSASEPFTSISIPEHHFNNYLTIPSPLAMAVAAATQVYEQSGLGPEDFQVIELHDCFSANELLLYEALGLCGEGEAPKLIDNNDTTYGGRWVVNPSGGLISKGHPLGATGLAQCSELTWQLRGEADKRQVEGAKTALQHNIGLGGAAVVTVYKPAA